MEIRVRRVRKERLRGGRVRASESDRSKRFGWWEEGGEEEDDENLGGEERGERMKSAFEGISSYRDAISRREKETNQRLDSEMN